MKRALCFAAALTALLAAPAALACAGCSNPNLPTSRGDVGGLEAGQILTTVNLSGTVLGVVHGESCPDIGPICGVRPEPDQLHDQNLYVMELRPIVEVGLSDVFGVEAHLPFRLTYTTITFRRLDGTAFTPDYEHIHHRNEVIAGFADGWLLGRATLRAWKFSFSGRAGLTLPWGKTEPDPFALAAEGKRHQHIQYGTGTFNPVLALDAALNLKPVTLSAYFQTVLALYANPHGYQAGHRFLGGLAAEVKLVDKLRLGVSGDVVNEQPERWGGRVQQDGNVGRTDILVGGLVGYDFGPVSLFATVKVPVWQHFIQVHAEPGVDPGQLRYPVVVNLGVQHLFGGGKKVTVGR